MEVRELVGMGSLPFETQGLSIHHQAGFVCLFVCGEVKCLQVLYFIMRSGHFEHKVPLYFVCRQLIYNYPEQLFGAAGVMAIEHADFAGVERLALVTGMEKDISF